MPTHSTRGRGGVAQLGIRALAVGTTVVLAGAAFAVLAALPADVWVGQRPATCLATSCFCEAFRPGPMKQPVNAASSLAFLVAAGVVLAGNVTNRPTNGVRGSESAIPGGSGDDLSHRAIAVALAAILAVIGLGSAVYHASFTFGAQFADVLGMHLLTALMLALAVRRAARLGRAGTWALFALLAGASAVILWAFPEVRRVLFGVLIVIALTIEVALNLRARRRRQPPDPGRRFCCLRPGLPLLGAGRDPDSLRARVPVPGARRLAFVGSDRGRRPGPLLRAARGGPLRACGPRPPALTRSKSPTPSGAGEAAPEPRLVSGVHCRGRGRARGHCDKPSSEQCPRLGIGPSRRFGGRSVTSSDSGGALAASLAVIGLGSAVYQPAQTSASNSSDRSRTAGSWE